jgi:hypothetical protein
LVVVSLLFVLAAEKKNYYYCCYFDFRHLPEVCLSSKDVLYNNNQWCLAPELLQNLIGQEQ